MERKYRKLPTSTFYPKLFCDKELKGNKEEIPGNLHQSGGWYWRFVVTLHFWQTVKSWNQFGKICDGNTFLGRPNNGVYFQRS